MKRVRRLLLIALLPFALTACDSDTFWHCSANWRWDYERCGG